MPVYIYKNNYRYYSLLSCANLSLSLYRKFFTIWSNEKILWLDKGFRSRLCLGFWVQHKIPEEGRQTYRQKFCVYNDVDKSPDILSDQNYQASSQKFWQITRYNVFECYTKQSHQINYYVWEKKGKTKNSLFLKERNKERKKERSDNVMY